MCPRGIKKEPEVNVVELDPSDNSSVYINGVRVTDVNSFRVGIGDVVEISFKADVKVKDSTS